jgi:hypothetical protein
MFGNFFDVVAKIALRERLKGQGVPFIAIAPQSFPRRLTVVSLALENCASLSTEKVLNTRLRVSLFTKSPRNSVFAGVALAKQHQ